MSGLGLSPQQQPQGQSQPQSPQLGEPLPSMQAAAKAGLRQVLNAAASWFFWIAGFSLFNTIMLISGSTWMFLAGLGVTYFMAIFGIRFGGGGQAMAIVISACAGAVFLAIGMIARKGSKGAFLAGMILYALDTLLVLAVLALSGIVASSVLIMVLFHGYVLWRLWRGYAVCSQIHAFEKDALAGPALGG